MPDACTVRQIYQRLIIACICLTSAGLSGCTTPIADKQLTEAHLHAPMKVLVMESPMQIEPGRLQTVFAPESKQKLSLSAQPVAQAISHAQHHALAKMDSALVEQAKLKVVTPPDNARPLIRQIAKTKFENILSQETADQLQTSTGADALLRFGITDYGLTPQTWRTGYITFEVVTTLAITAAIASVGTTIAKGAAGTYLAQEALEETAESYAGFWAVDVVYRPVRIEAQLLSLNPVRVLWQYSDTGLSDFKFSRLTQKVTNAERDQQLDQSSDEAVSEIADTLSGALVNLHYLAVSAPNPLAHIPVTQ